MIKYFEDLIKCIYIDHNLKITCFNITNKFCLFFIDPEIILREESTKIPCKWYLTNGECAFGLGCRYSHYTPPMIWELQRLGIIHNNSMINKKNIAQYFYIIFFLQLL